MARICLCSSSESRALLLNNFGVDFVQRTVAYDEEKITTPIAKDFVYTASKGKLDAAVRQFGLETPLLCADTVIAAADGTILTKSQKCKRCKTHFKDTKRFYYLYYLLCPLQVKESCIFRYFSDTLSFFQL